MNAKVLLAMLCTQLVFLLYGAGLRRPFGSLETSYDVPKVLRAMPFASFDVLYLMFLAVMWILLFIHMDTLWFAVTFVAFAIGAEVLSQRIALLPSIGLSIVLSVCALILIATIEGSR